MAGRAVHGRVYEIVTRGQPPDAHAYVGKVTAPTTIHQRLFGRSASAHTSAESIAHDPWKAGILPGRAGYRQLEVVYATGDPAEDDRALRRAEAFWIDRLRPEHNIVRPVRPAGQNKPLARPRHAPRRPVRPARRRRRPVAKPLALLALTALFTTLIARVVVGMQLPWPLAPWIASPALGTFFAWQVFWRAHRSLRKLLR